MSLPQPIIDKLAKYVKAVDYHRFPGTNTVVCCVTMTNNFNCIGASTASSGIPNNGVLKFHQGLAYKAAMNEVNRHVACINMTKVSLAEILSGG